MDYTRSARCFGAVAALLVWGAQRLGLDLGLDAVAQAAPFMVGYAISYIAKDPRVVAIDATLDEFYEVDGHPFPPPDSDPGAPSPPPCCDPVSTGVSTPTTDVLNIDIAQAIPVLAEAQRRTGRDQELDFAGGLTLRVTRLQARVCGHEPGDATLAAVTHCYAAATT